ncbi:acetyl-CoA synthetase-like protein [Lojkania enalia]|uniref:Acetyl-CoA synthetase-like protein n=1 Tax=Lojkania enalia TaxID=147567 RepID=A0A9P4N0S4_9PLEO|nr:acetyl-CoA synthetase-like protein [Didymosphaeria enalia]
MATKQAQISEWRHELTPNIVDRLAKLTPDVPYALYPNSPETYDQGYRTVTYKDFANAINGLAWWLDEHLGPSKDFDVLAYIGPNDVRYTALLLGAVKAGYVAFLTSPRNSISAHGALFEQVKCHMMLTPKPTPPAVKSILSAHSMKHLQVPSVAELLDKEYPHYSYHKTFQMARMEPFVIIHTSGSTGTPKPLIWTHESAARASNQGALDPPPGFQTLGRLFQDKLIFNTFPPFHAACLAIHLFVSVPFGAVSVAPLSGSIATAESVVQALKQAPAKVAFLVPSIVAELTQNSALLEYCSQHLELILYAGGDLPQQIGDAIAAKVPIRCQYGASEIGLTSQLIAPDMSVADWRYVRYHPELGLEFEEIAPGMFEMIVKRDSRFEENQLPFSIGPSLQNLQHYRSRDLFQKHPTVSDCWGWRARADDIVVFLNGEKTNPLSMEHHIVLNNEDVSAALVVGMQRFQAALLVEPTARLGKLSQNEEAAFIEKIWPSIDEANKFSPAHARIEKLMILLTTPEKPMSRAGKGTIQRNGTIDQYTAEIDDIYFKADTALSGAEKASVNSEDPDQVSLFIQQAIAKINPELLREGAANFFALGMDSLMALRLIRALRHGLGQQDLPLSIVYSNPSVEQLTQQIISGRAIMNNQDASRQRSDIEVLLDEYKQKIERISAQSSGSGEVVLLTGSTGSLGTHLLEALLANPTVSHVYCLNRRQNARELHEAKVKTSGLRPDQFNHRLSFFHGILDQPNMGLDEATYRFLRSTTTLIIHNAWPVNFIMPLKNFRPQFDGLINLFHFTSGRVDPPKVLYISSISSAGSYSRSSPSRAIPEVVIQDLDAPYDIGYAKSKLLSELLCDVAARSLCLPIALARVGQIAGPVNGQTTRLWNMAEWLPSLILTSVSLGVLPDDLGRELSNIDWMPVDMLATALVEIGTMFGRNREGDAEAGAQVFNLVNPRATSWKQLLPTIISSVEKYASRDINVVPLASWLHQLGQIAEGSANATELARTYPAIKLQEFYETNMLRDGEALNWKMERTIEMSKTIRDMPAVGEDWIERWVQGWVAELRERGDGLSAIARKGGFAR